MGTLCCRFVGRLEGVWGFLGWGLAVFWSFSPVCAYAYTGNILATQLIWLACLLVWLVWWGMDAYYQDVASEQIAGGLLFLGIGLILLVRNLLIASAGEFTAPGIFIPIEMIYLSWILYWFGLREE